MMAVGLQDKDCIGCFYHRKISSKDSLSLSTQQSYCYFKYRLRFKKFGPDLSKLAHLHSCETVCLI